MPDETRTLTVGKGTKVPQQQCHLHHACIVYDYKATQFTRVTFRTFSVQQTSRNVATCGSKVTLI